MNLLANILAARGEDGNPELWFYLVLAIVFIGKSVISYLKTKREDNEEEPDLETEDHHEKRVREVIAEMRRTVPERPQQAPRQEVPQPRVAARAPRPEAQAASTTGPRPGLGARTCAGSRQKYDGTLREGRGGSA